MQAFKEKVGKVLKGLALSEDLVDDLLMGNGYRLKLRVHINLIIVCI